LGLNTVPADASPSNTPIQNFLPAYSPVSPKTFPSDLHWPCLSPKTLPPPVSPPIDGSHRPLTSLAQFFFSPPPGHHSCKTTPIGGLLFFFRNVFIIDPPTKGRFSSVLPSNGWRSPLPPPRGFLFRLALLFSIFAASLPPAVFVIFTDPINKVPPFFSQRSWFSVPTVLSKVDTPQKVGVMADTP